MNTAAAIAFVTVMLTGMGGITALVYRDRRRTAPPAEAPEDGGLDGALWPRPTSVYDETVRAVGDPGRIDIQPPAFLW